MLLQLDMSLCEKYAHYCICNIAYGMQREKRWKKWEALTHPFYKYIYACSQQAQGNVVRGEKGTRTKNNTIMDFLNIFSFWEKRKRKKKGIILNSCILFWGLKIGKKSLGYLYLCVCAVGSHGDGKGLDSYEQLGRGVGFQRCYWKVATGLISSGNQPPRALVSVFLVDALIFLYLSQPNFYFFHFINIKLLIACV